MRLVSGSGRWRLLTAVVLAGTSVLLAPLAHGGTLLEQDVPHREWVAGRREPPPSMSPPRYAVEREEADVILRDGTVLKANLFLPVRPRGDNIGPCIVSTNGYASPSTLGQPILEHVTGPELEDLARRGYAGAFVFLRSDGVPRDEALYYRYAEDGYDVVEWMAARPWCNGKVGMVGASLSGISQWLTAREGPPSLKAIIPKAACGDCYWHLWYRGGMLPDRSRKDRRPPVAAYDEYRAAIAHRDYDAWWRRRDTDSNDYRAMAESGVAVLHLGGWDDYIHAGGLRAVEQLIAAGGDGMLVIGPWAHDAASTTQPGLAPYDFQTFTVLWFDRFLRGIDNGIDDRQALLYVEGTGKYRFEERWPIPDTRATPLYLRAAESGAVDSLNDGSLQACPPEQDEAPAVFRHDPNGPFNHAGAGSARPAGDQQGDEKNSLTWTTAALATPLEVTGWPVLKFWASSTAPDADFVAELTAVAPDGTSTQVTRGWLSGPHSFSRSDPRPLVPERVYHFTLELMPISYVFPVGHRIRMSLSGSDAPGMTVNPQAATISVLQNAEYESQLELPVIGADYFRDHTCNRRSGQPVSGSAFGYSSRSSNSASHRFATESSPYRSASRRKSSTSM